MIEAIGTEAGSGNAAPGARPARVRVIACGMLAREILAIREQLGLDHLDLVCLPAQFHFEPQRIVPAMEKAIAEARAEGIERIFAGYGDCGTGGMLDALLERHGIERIEGPHCFAFYQGMEAFRRAAEDDFTAFYMTDFLCRHFDSFFLKPLGLDRHPELAAVYFAHYRALVYLAQTEDPALEAVARKAAAMLGLTYERRYTGYGDLAGALQRAATA